MILIDDQIKELAIAETDEWIEVAREDSRKLKAHFFGENKADYISQIAGLESEEQFDLRKKHSISNKHLVENIKRPVDNIWSAKGGLIKVEMKTETLQKEFDEQIQNVKGGLDDTQYLKNIWEEALFTDPSGLLFMELSKDGENAYLTQKTIFDIKNMKVSGLIPEYVVLNPDQVIEEDEGIETNKKTKAKKDESKKTRLMWIIDDSFYHRVKVKGDEVTILKSIPNSFGEVPAIINSSVYDTNRKIHVSPLWKQVELLDNYLLNNSVKEIHQFLHGYPIFWMYAKRCDSCNGKGESRDGDGNFSSCNSCNGTGRSRKKDVSDAILLAPPKDKDAPTIDNPAGYVEPAIDTWKEQRIELDWKENQLFFSHWGTTTERKDNETATGRFIDVQPINNRLHDYSTIAERVHKWILEKFALFIAENSVKSITVNYGRRYLIETPDQIWEKYLKSKTDNAPDTSLSLLLEQYYESEYQHNDMLRDYYLKIMKVEPYPNKSVEEVVALPLADEVKKAKLYFQDWLSVIMITQVNESTVEELKKDLESFVNDKQLNTENGTTKESGE